MHVDPGDIAAIVRAVLVVHETFETGAAVGGEGMRRVGGQFVQVEQLGVDGACCVGEWQTLWVYKVLAGLQEHSRLIGEEVALADDAGKVEGHDGVQ